MEGHGKTGLLVGFAGYLLQRQDGSKDLDGGGVVNCRLGSNARAWAGGSERSQMDRAGRDGGLICAAEEELKNRSAWTDDG
jgi:hypothetical protein